MRKSRIFSLVLLLLVVGGASWYANTHVVAPKKNPPHKIQVVAAENFWGNLVSQIGGSKVAVLSIVSDPNADPHEYASTTTDARAVATANYVIMNGIGYDDWVSKLLSASPNNTRVVLSVGDLVGKQKGDNPHVWYSPTYVNEATQKMEQDLIAIDPSDKAYFQAQYKRLQQELALYQQRIAQIKQQYSGVKVAATEDVFAYLAEASGLDLISPTSFTEAVSEGNDPPANSVVQFQQQLASNQVKVLVYNKQTVTPITDSMKQLATTHSIPTVGMSETMQPPQTSFQLWMNAQVTQLQNALGTSKVGQ